MNAAEHRDLDCGDVDLDAAIAERIASLDMAAELNSQGLPAVYVDEGRIVSRAPDGTVTDLGGLDGSPARAATRP